MRSEHLVDDRLGDEAREGVADPLALEGGDQIVDRQRSDRGQSEGAERVDDGQDRDPR